MFFVANISQKYFNVIMNAHGRHNIRNGIVWAQTGHSTGTWTVSLHVVIGFGRNSIAHIGLNLTLSFSSQT